MVRATDLFSQWAADGRDERMASGHAPAVSEILSQLEPYLPPRYTFGDLGCGNGWVVRGQASQERVTACLGVDGAAQMIAKAAALDSPKCKFVQASRCSAAARRDNVALYLGHSLFAAGWPAAHSHVVILPASALAVYGHLPSPGCCVNLPRPTHVWRVSLQRDREPALAPAVRLL